MKLTKNFSKSEFESKDGSKMPDDVLKNIIVLANNLQVLRDHLGSSIKINSGYRSPAHNKKVNGAKNSFHIKGMASDLKSKTHSPKEIYDTIEKLISEGKMMQGGLGIYKTFTHYDIRSKKLRWSKIA